MLEDLAIKNFALIDEVSLDFSDGFKLELVSQFSSGQ